MAAPRGRLVGGALVWSVGKRREYSDFSIGD
jgi:hypothetical protein